MEKYIGKSVYKGTAIGPVNVLKKSESLIKRVHVENVDEELKRLDKAKEKTLQQLARLYDKALKEVGKVNAEIFEVHQIMLEDEDYQDAIRNMIRDNKVPQIDGIVYSSNKEEMHSMDFGLLNLYKEGRITAETALSYASNPEMLKKKL